jgi:hypothetical protein
MAGISESWLTLLTTTNWKRKHWNYGEKTMNPIDKMKARIRKLTPEWNAILGDDKPTEGMYMNQRQVDEMNAAITQASKNYETLSQKERVQITMGLQMAWWSLQKLNGDHKSEPKQGAPTVTKAQIDSVRQYLTTA